MLHRTLLPFNLCDSHNNGCTCSRPCLLHTQTVHFRLESFLKKQHILPHEGYPSFLASKFQRLCSLWNIGSDRFCEPVGGSTLRHQESSSLLSQRAWGTGNPAVNWHLALLRLYLPPSFRIQIHMNFLFEKKKGQFLLLKKWRAF